MKNLKRRPSNQLIILRLKPIKLTDLAKHTSLFTHLELLLKYFALLVLLQSSVKNQSDQFIFLF